MLARRNKFNAKRSLGWGGRMFDSTAERQFVDELKLREVAHDVEKIDLQPVVHLVAGITYRPDVVHTDLRTGERIFTDVKGVETPEFRMKAKLWGIFGPGRLQIVKRAGRSQRFTVTREVRPDFTRLVSEMAPETLTTLCAVLREAGA